MRKKTKKLLVAMSGGVDSSVAAALLRKRGFEVEGIFMRLWTTNIQLPETRLKSESAQEYARGVAEKLGIKFRVLDLRKEFKRRVINYFLREFKAGRTPNPCIVCNQEMKFGLLFKEALKLGYDFVATGHYARIRRIESLRTKPTILPSPCQEGEKRKCNSKIIFKLLQAKDKTKDQSYFLYNLTQSHLKQLLFPIGEYKKTEVYKMAKKWDLPHKPEESVDICFLAGQDHKVFLRKYLGVTPGKIINTSGEVLGEHLGLAFYTIGQRAEIGGPGPFYVVKLDARNNLVIVTNNPRDEKLYRRSLIAEKVNWIAGKEPKMPLRCRAKIRYRHEVVPVIVGNLVPKGGLSFQKPAYQVVFKTPQRAVTPGQSVVFYKRNEVLGGGVIEIEA